MRGIKDYKGMFIRASEWIKRNKTTKDIRKKFTILTKYLKTEETFLDLEKDKDRALRDIKNLFILKKDKGIKDRVLGDINRFRLEKDKGIKEDYTSKDW